MDELIKAVAGCKGWGDCEMPGCTHRRQESQPQQELKHLQQFIYQLFVQCLNDFSDPYDDNDKSHVSTMEHCYKQLDYFAKQVPWGTWDYEGQKELEEEIRQHQPHPADEREAFERWYQEENGHFARREGDTYQLGSARNTWIAWQARGEYESRKASSNEANPDVREALRDCIEYIEGCAQRNEVSWKLLADTQILVKAKVALSALPARVDEEGLWKALEKHFDESEKYEVWNGTRTGSTTDYLPLSAVEKDVLMPIIRPYLTRQPAEIGEDEAVNAMLTGYCGYIRKGSARERMTRAYRALQAKCHITRRAGE